jgi:hypothetical protein
MPQAIRLREQNGTSMGELRGAGAQAPLAREEVGTPRQRRPGEGGGPLDRPYTSPRSPAGESALSPRERARRRRALSSLGLDKRYPESAPSEGAGNASASSWNIWLRGCLRRSPRGALSRRRRALPRPIGRRMFQSDPAARPSPVRLHRRVMVPDGPARRHAPFGSCPYLPASRERGSGPARRRRSSFHAGRPDPGKRPSQGEDERRVSRG